MLSDPAKVVKGPDIRRFIRKVGRPVITLLVSPPNLPVKPPSRNFRVMTHADYDYKQLDSFPGTSLHLSFTQWMFSLNDGDYGLIDQAIFLAEAVVTVRDSGRWIADMNLAGDWKIMFPTLHVNAIIGMNLSLKHIFRLILGKNYWIHHWLLGSSELTENGRRDWRPSVY